MTYLVGWDENQRPSSRYKKRRKRSSLDERKSHVNELLKSTLRQTKLSKVRDQESNGRGSSRKRETCLSNNRGLRRRRGRNDECLELRWEKEIEKVQDLQSLLKADRRGRS